MTRDERKAFHCQLATRATAGDREALGVLIEDLRPLIRSRARMFLRNMRGGAVGIDDLEQTAAIYLLNALPKWRLSGGASVAHFAMRCAAYAMLNVKSRQKKHLDNIRADQDSKDEYERATARESLYSDRTLGELLSAIEQLPRLERLALCHGGIDPAPIVVRAGCRRRLRATLSAMAGRKVGEKERDQLREKARHRLARAIADLV